MRLVEGEGLVISNVYFVPLQRSGDGAQGALEGHVRIGRHNAVGTAVQRDDTGWRVSEVSRGIL